MKTIKLIMTAAVTLLMAYSCEDVFENKAVNEYKDKDVWRIPDFAEGVLTSIYSSIPDRFDTYDGNFLDVATDNAVTNSYSSGVYRVANGALSRSENPIGNWSDCYDQLQNIHLFMEKGLSDSVVYDKENPETGDLIIKNRMRGECYFLRAWWSFYLLQRHGGRTDAGDALGYVLLDRYITADQAKDPAGFVRSSYAECIESIIADCDSAAMLLPNAYSGNNAVIGATQIGRATAMGARVLKSRAATYGASPAYRPASVVNITGMGQYSVVDAAKYAENWEYAALLSDTVIRTSGFGAFIALAYENIVSLGNTPADFVFRRYYHANGIEQRHFPPYYWGNAQTTPSQNLVDAFPSKSGGYPISHPGAAYSDSDPYATVRDNRFNLVLYHHGRPFGDGSMGAIDIVSGGKDAPDYSPKGTRTGYYLSKFISRNGNLLKPTAEQSTGHYTPILRKSEVFYNFAEASNEAWGPTAKGPGCMFSAYDVMKTIRAAYGISPDNYIDEISGDKDKFRELIQNERRLDFAFENHRFFDMRRWLLDLNQPVCGVVADRSNGAVVYRYHEVEKRKFDDVRHYYLPVPLNEMLKNPGMVNNIGWDNN